jgi:hypothetical protein
MIVVQTGKVVSIAPHASFPAAPPTDSAFDGKVFKISMGNTIEIAGLCSANSGKLRLVRHVKDSLWTVVDNDAGDTSSIGVDATLPTGITAGRFSRFWKAGDVTKEGGIFMVIQDGTATFDHLFAVMRWL